jgi:hypothetical protein
MRTPGGRPEDARRTPGGRPEDARRTPGGRLQDANRQLIKMNYLALVPESWSFFENENLGVFFTYFHFSRS